MRRKKRKKRLKTQRKENMKKKQSCPSFKHTHINNSQFIRFVKSSNITKREKRSHNRARKKSSKSPIHTSTLAAEYS